MWWTGTFKPTRLEVKQHLKRGSWLERGTGKEQQPFRIAGRGFESRNRCKHQQQGGMPAVYYCEMCGKGRMSKAKLSLGIMPITMRKHQ